jgi:uncharacterized protein (DUF1330 family)
MQIDPSGTQAQALGETPQDAPVIFLNCHKYHERAQYAHDYHNPDMPSDVSGMEAYHRYLTAVERDFMPDVGGRFLLAGPVELVLIGDGDWDEVVVGEYPSKTEAFRMQTLPGYSDINVHRLAGLQNVLTLSFSQSDQDRSRITDAWRYRVSPSAD